MYLSGFVDISKVDNSFFTRLQVHRIQYVPEGHTGIERMVIREDEATGEVFEKLLQAAKLLLELRGQVGGGSDLSEHFADLAYRLYFLLLENLRAQRQQRVVRQNRFQHEVAVEDLVHETSHLHDHQLGLREPT